ncbi:radical SAM protein, partial [Pseudomonas aeruginosa]
RLIQSGSRSDAQFYRRGEKSDRLLGNIHFDRVDWQRLVAHVRETPLTRALYTHPLTELLARLESTDLLRSIIAKANNPYWLVKELAGHAGLLEQWEVA